MSKYLNIPQGNYKITVQDGGLITLDPGGLGSVIVTGNLTVQGETTYLSTTDSEITDNTILLNAGEVGNGISREGGTSGLQIERGTLPDAKWLFVEDITYEDPSNEGTVRTGAWSARDNSLPTNRVLAIETVSIVTPGTDLNLLGTITSGPNPGKISVKGTVNYEQNLEDYHIPNVKYVDDLITFTFANTFQASIKAGDPTANNNLEALTSLTVYDNSTDIGVSRAELILDDILTQEWYADYTDFYGIRVEQTDLGTEIKTVSTAENDLILSATGTGSVVIEDNLRLARIGHEGDDAAQPNAPQEGVIFYANNSNAGATGVYFANEDGQRDELISRNRALIYSMLF